MSKNRVYGIDLGTSYSCISYIDSTGMPAIIKNFEGENITPSVVNVKNKNNYVVGSIAKETAVVEPNETLQFFKQKMGTTKCIYNNGNLKISPEEASGYVLRKLANDASRIIDEEVKNVVITIPAYFGTAERIATINASKIAGLNVLSLINEPTAAAIYYGCNRYKNNENILVFDLGGGTFDITIMQVKDGSIDEVCKDGIRGLGGKDFDETLFNYVFGLFKKSTNFKDNMDDYSKQDLILKVEKAKLKLSSRADTTVICDINGKKDRIKITRDDFERITKTLVDKMIEKTDSVINVARNKGVEVSTIVLVGGSTRMPMIEKVLKEKYQKTVKILEPDEAVVKGACIYAQSLIDGSNPKIKEKITYVTNKSYATEFTRGNMLVCSNIIIKNQKMANGEIEKKDVFYTTCDDQEEVRVGVYESDITDKVFDLDNDYLIGEASLNLKGHHEKGSPIEVCFKLTKEGILEVRARDLSGSSEISTIIQAKNGTCLTSEELNALIKLNRYIKIE